jgi:hypothetical protein
VIAYERDGKWRLDCYTPDEFMAFSSVPPFKIYFNVPLDDRAAPPPAEKSRKIHLTKVRLHRLRDQFDELRKLEE